MKIIKTVTETTSKPFVFVIATDEADAEIFAQENAHLIEPYFEGMETGTATEIDKSDFHEFFLNKETEIKKGVFHVPFN